MDAPIASQGSTGAGMVTSRYDVHARVTEYGGWPSATTRRALRAGVDRDRPLDIRQTLPKATHKLHLYEERTDVYA